MQNRCCTFVVALFLFQFSLSSRAEFVLRGTISQDSNNETVVLNNDVDLTSNFCGEFSTSYSTNATNGDITYIFHGIENAAPTTFERIQICQSPINNSTIYNEVSLLSLLDLNMTCEISYFSNPITYIIRRLDVVFTSITKRSFFNCSDTHPLNQYIPVESLTCSSEIIHRLVSQINSEQELSVLNYNSRIEVEDVLGTMDLALLNKNACDIDVVSVVGSFFAFVLVGVFLFLIVYAYNNNRRTSKYIGNGIDVRSEHVISKPFSCAINPYSKKVKEIPITAPSNEGVSSVEIDTIMINQGGHHSSFYMM